MEQQLVVFELANEFYGINIGMVESIIKMQTVTKLPHARDFVEGVTNLRGIVLPVIDLRKCFNLISREADKKSRIIVVRLDQTEVGMIVDEVHEVLTVPAGAVEPTPAITSPVDSAFITGIAKIDPRLVILLDLNRVLKAEEQAKSQMPAE